MSAQRVVIAAGLAVVVAAFLVLWTSDGSESPSGAAPAPTGGEGFDKAIWGPVELPDGGSAFTAYEQLGVETFQYQLTWAEIAPERPTDPENPDDPAYRWPEEIDAALAEAEKRGMQIALLITTAPPWANGGREPIWAPERDEDFQDFVTAAAERYPTVRRWQIWGETNRSDRFQPNAVNDPRGPERYAELLDAAYEALKASSEENVVIGGNTYTGGEVRPPDFLRWLRLPSGEPPRLDWYGHDPYPFRLPDLRNSPYPGGWRDLSDLDTLVGEVDAAYQSLGIEPRLWLSEFTIQSERPSRYFAKGVSREEQAAWLAAGYRVAAEVPEVAGLGWFTLLDEPQAPGSANWGLLSSDGAPKPAFDAYREAGGER